VLKSPIIVPAIDGNWQSIYMSWYIRFTLLYFRRMETICTWTITMKNMTCSLIWNHFIGSAVNLITPCYHTAFADAYTEWRIKTGHFVSRLVLIRSALNLEHAVKQSGHVFMRHPVLLLLQRALLVLLRCEIKQESPANAKGTRDSSACMKSHCEQM